MANAEMDAIEVQDTPMGLQRTLSPVLKLLGQALIEPTDRAGTGSHSQQGLSHFSDFVRARSCDKHLGEPFCDMRFVATVALEGLGVELTFTIVFER